MGAPLHRALESVALVAVPSLDEALTLGAFELQYVGRELRPSHLDTEVPAAPSGLQQFDPEPIALDEIVAEHGRDGADYTRVCNRHGWASRAVVSSSLAERAQCPFCDAERDGGRERYRELTARLFGRVTSAGGAVHVDA